MASTELARMPGRNDRLPLGQRAMDAILGTPLLSDILVERFVKCTLGSLRESDQEPMIRQTMVSRVANHGSLRLMLFALRTIDFSPEEQKVLAPGLERAYFDGVFSFAGMAQKRKGYPVMMDYSAPTTEIFEGMREAIVRTLRKAEERQLDQSIISWLKKHLPVQMFKDQPWKHEPERQV